MAADKPTPSRLCLECLASLDGEHGNRVRCTPCAKQHKLKRKQTPEYKAQQREYARKRSKTEAQQAYIHAYRRTPEARKRARDHMRKRRQTEEYQEYLREYLQRPEVKAAMRERSRAYNQRPEVKEKLRQQRRTPEHKARRYKYSQTYLSNPKVKERRRDWAREYNQKPEIKKRQRERIQQPEAKERRRKYAREYQQRPEVKEHKRAYLQEYSQQPEVKKRKAARQRLRKPWDATVTPEAVAAMLKAQRGRCVECKADIRKAYHMDHIVPQSKGGPSTLSNLQLLCRTCNISKGAKDPFEFAALKGRLL